MSNRHDRRAAASAARRKRENVFYDAYIKHLPQVALDAPLERGRVFHVCIHHDPWCQIYDSDPPRV